MPSHVYFFNRSAAPEWGSDRETPVDPAAIAARRRLARALLRALPGSVQQLIDQDAEHRWEAVHLAPLSIVIWADHVHVRIPYWTSAELRRHAADLNLATVADVLADIAGYDFVEHRDQGLGAESDVLSVIDYVGSEGDARHAALRNDVPTVLRARRTAYMRLPEATFPIDWLTT